MTSTSTRRPDREPVGLRRSGAPGPLDRPPGPVARRMNTFVRTLAASWVADPRVAVSLAGAGVLLGMLLGATAPNAEAIGVRLPLSLLPSLSGQTVLASLMLYAAEILAGLGLAGMIWANSKGWRPDPRHVLLVASLVVAVMVCLTPVGSSDVASYAAYGRIAAQGGNPYLTSPSAWGEAAYLDPVGMMWKDQPSVYGPVATLLQSFAAWVGGSHVGTTVLTWMVLNGVVFLGVGVLLLRTSDDPVRATLFWTANPVLILALLRRSATALVALVVPVAVWLSLFGSLLGAKSAAPAPGELTVLTHNVDAGNADPAATARAIAHDGSDLVALEELSPAALPVYERGLAAAYPYRAVEGTVALWSRYPLSGTRPVDIKLGWTRALRTDVATPHGRLAVYVAHMPSVRVQLHGGFTADQRDVSATALGDTIAAEPLPRVLLLGDLNGTMNDRSLAPVTAQLRSAQGAAGDGFGFSWPATFPMARIDQIMVRGVTPVSSWVLPADGSDHLPVAATLRLS